MVLRSEPYDHSDRRDPVRDEWEEWFEVAEDEQIAEGNITVSDTVDGHDPTPDLDDEDVLDEFDRLIDEEDL